MLFVPKFSTSVVLCQVIDHLWTLCRSKMRQYRRARRRRYIYHMMYRRILIRSIPTCCQIKIPTASSDGCCSMNVVQGHRLCLFEMKVQKLLFKHVSVSGAISASYQKCVADILLALQNIVQNSSAWMCCCKRPNSLPAGTRLHSLLYYTHRLLNEHPWRRITWNLRSIRYSHVVASNKGSLLPNWT
jgi:hypothetical protein